MKNSVFVFGAGKLGCQIANDLSKEGMNVTIVDISNDAFNKLEDFSGFTRVADCTNPSAIENFNLNGASLLVVATHDDNTNIFLACMIAAYYDVPYIIVRVRDEKKAAIITDEKINIISTSSLSLQAYKAIHSQEEDNI